jgi:hypothetical protein
MIGLAEPVHDRLQVVVEESLDHHGEPLHGDAEATLAGTAVRRGIARQSQEGLGDVADLFLGADDLWLHGGISLRQTFSQGLDSTTRSQPASRVLPIPCRHK